MEKSEAVAPITGFAGIPWIASHPVVYPALEVLHIAGIAMLLGSLLVLELRVWGLGPALPVRPLAKLALGITVTGFVLVAFSGLLMFAGHPAELLANRAFLIKLGLVQVAGLNALWFHGRDSLARCDRVARLQTVVSTGLWLAAIICGRWIAYL